jgi:hypothetical protein
MTLAFADYERSEVGGVGNRLLVSGFYFPLQGL